ncbi:farnesyl-diphosphate farnesyltransferase [Methylomarinovum caldicuralii]|uniref:Farnesyl-diphosphate farnesyltransferase n=1 Tax=Methylomarinovum caldicuralii TaxID=438856 RepID=A0AAU9BZQ2_9GAMM|nr:phytoene/squalene synthase family protein [Methylomarinovum caldicuralii]BCX81542.1 farnesyl-diphosphate farnesyltransferase [Methylomarinovum caldicuralii]
MNGSAAASVARDLNALDDAAFQAHLLEGVSRTFALTIPQLPEPVHQVVANGYLLCRIVDTIEDEPLLDRDTKRRFCERFVAVVQGRADAESFAQEFAALLSEQTPPAEHALIRVIPRVIAITHGFSRDDREALATCVDIMGHGMADFQDRDLSHGLPTLQDMNHYCYYVAGVVGEMLTRVFCNYSQYIAQHRNEMMPLAVSFGQGLQMTNILKDVWTDLERGVCWLPQDVFQRQCFSLDKLRPGHNDPRFVAGLRDLIAIAHGHLRNALEYTLLIPEYETGLRDFCLWALGMAVLTLRKIDAHPYYRRGDEVKISRRSVKATIVATRICHRHDDFLRALFALASRGLPGPAKAEWLDLSAIGAHPKPDHTNNRGPIHDPALRIATPRRA